MISGGGGGGLPLPRSGPEWVALIAAIVIVVWAVKRWLDT